MSSQDLLTKFLVLWELERKYSRQALALQVANPGESQHSLNTAHNEYASLWSKIRQGVFMEFQARQ